jgi:CheY-like chemotaxis protein
MMERQVEHMVRMVDDLLEISRITRGSIEMRKERVNLTAVIENAVETSKPLMERVGHRFTLSLPAKTLFVDADAVRLAQVFANILNNAAKFTPGGGEVQLSVSVEDHQAVVSVRDTGVGIAAPMLPRVFDMFAQAVSGREGLGIGLSLSRKLVELHGGTVEARSEGLGKGSEFVIRLPLAPERATEQALLGTANNLRLTPRRILIVDDNRDAADSLGLLLRSAGADIRVVYDGGTALQEISRYEPDVVLLDLGMPGIDGYEVARRTRARPEHNKVALVALTGWGQQEDRDRARDAGFDHHLVKPADIDKLHALLESLHTGDPA